jgi:choline dehydrogenase-like flavoprotein
MRAAFTFPAAYRLFGIGKIHKAVGPLFDCPNVSFTFKIFVTVSNRIMETSSAADYIVVGGGLTGCALAARLAELLRNGPPVSILLLEAGPEPGNGPNVTQPMAGFGLQGSELDWAYPTVPVPALADRVLTLTSGKVLGGGSILNYGGWARGDASDYDAWAKIVNDERWNYKNLLPYMKRSERFSKADADPEQNGLDGPMKVTSVSASDPRRRYPLREPIQKAWAELGVETVPPCTGKLAGLSEFLETWQDGERRPSQLAYDLKGAGVQVRTETAVHRVLFGSRPNQLPRATGVLLASGQSITANKEVLLAAGAFRSPQLLQLSGVGPAELLARHSIPVIHNAPDVGRNLFDHFALFQVFHLKNSERGLALGHPALADPAFVKGLPTDWAANEALPAPLLQEALLKDGDSLDEHGLSKKGRTHVETMILYHPLAPGVPVDGSYIGTSVMLTLPTSRGKVDIASASPDDGPLIDPNYFTTAVDKEVLVHGVRRLLECLLSTSSGQEVIENEVAPGPGMQPLTVDSTREEIEDRIRSIGFPHFHPGGTCALGSVLDAELRVKGVQGLRVVDASVFPAPLGGHPQASLYCLAERAAAFIAGK